MGVSDAEWMAQGLTMQKIAELRWAIASHAMAAQDRGRGNEIDVSAFDVGGDIPSHHATYTQRPSQGPSRVVSGPIEPSIASKIGGVAREAISGYFRPLTSIIGFNMQVQDFALVAIKNGMNSIRKVLETQ